MKPSNFDELTKALAESRSRRHALKVILTASVGGLFGLTSVSTAFGRHHRRAKVAKPSGPPPGNSNCAKFCAAVYGPNTPAANQCTSDAAHNKSGNLCKQCGGDSSSICCNKNGSGFCDGTPGATCCSTNETCIAGSCCPTANKCGSICLGAPCEATLCQQCDETTGTCVSMCGSNESCQSGQCVCTPNCTGNACGSDDGCGGTCGTGTCPSPQTCLAGICCVPLRGSCVNDTDCCQGQNGLVICTDSFCLLVDGGRCTDGSDCAGGCCVNGACASASLC